MRGTVSQFWINFDQLYKYGFTKFLNQFKFPYKKTIEEIDRELIQTTDGGIYGYLNGCELYAHYETLSKKKIKVQMLRFNINKPFFRRTEPVTFNSFVNNLKSNPIEFLPDVSVLNEYINCDNIPINFLRDRFGLPPIGEGWVSETKLFYQLSLSFSDNVLVQHGKPKWLGRQHFDIYFPLLNIAVEYQGKQHFESVEYFGGEEALKNNIQRDNLKRKKCIDNDCELIYVFKGYNLEDVINNIKGSENYLKYNRNN